MKTIHCPKGHGPMELKKLHKEKTFKGVDIAYEAEAFVCPDCGLEAGTVKTAGAVQCAIADAYREKVGLLTGREIKSLRKGKDLTQQQLADAMKVGIASIKRWETGMSEGKMGTFDFSAFPIGLVKDGVEFFNGIWYLGR